MQKTLDYYIFKDMFAMLMKHDVGHILKIDAMSSYQVKNKG